MELKTNGKTYITVQVLQKARCIDYIIPKSALDQPTFKGERIHADVCGPL